jgi:hypothetical protein
MRGRYLRSFTRCFPVLLVIGSGVIGCKKMPKMSMIRPVMPPSAGVNVIASDDFAGLSPASPEETGTAAAELAGVEQTSNAVERLIIYDATVRLVVKDVPGTLSSLKRLASSLGGYMQAMSDNSITLRIPAKQLNETLQRVEDMGEVTSRDIRATDVTEEMLDLDIRLRNAEEARNRLIKLLDKAEKVEDMLKIEKELQRVTEDIERMKGRIKYLSQAVAFSTITVNLNAIAPAAEMREVIPFHWVRQLGDDVTLDEGMEFAPSKRFRPWIRMTLPPSYVRVLDEDGCTRALSGRGVAVLVQRERNFQGGTLEFWTPIVRRWLAQGRAMSVGESVDVALDGGAKGIAMSATVTAGRKTCTYLLSMAVNKDHVYIFECWGPQEDVNKDRDALAAAFRSMNVRP